jgi:hypothetical protein
VSLASRAFERIHLNVVVVYIASTRTTSLLLEWFQPQRHVPHPSLHSQLTYIVRQAKQLQASLMEIVDRVEVVKNEHEKLEGGNRFLQS